MPGWFTRRPVFWLGLALWLLAAPLGAALWMKLRGPSPPLPTLGPAPDFALVDQHGETRALADIVGQVTVVDFIFTRCPDVCPLMTTKMVWLAEQIPPASTGGMAVGFMSVSVDPTWDTPERLVAYGDRYGVDHDRWRLLTGESAAVEATIAGFQQGIEYTGALDAEGVPDIRHSQRFILVDQFGMIRGFYDSDADGLRAIRDDAVALAAEAGALAARGVRPSDVAVP